MTLHTPVFAQPVAGDVNFPNGIPFSAQELRRNIQAALSVASPAAQSGVTPLDGQFAVSQHAAGANLSVDVAAGHAFVAGTDVANQAVYGCWNDGVVNVTTPAPPATGTEVHRLVLQVEDKFNNALFTGYTANLNLLADTGSGTPPAPASSITLALISISAGQASVLNANITDQRPLLGATPWITVTLDAGWGAGGRSPRYRLLPDGNVQLDGFAQLAAPVSVSTPLNSGHPVPAAFRPQLDIIVNEGNGGLSPVHGPCTMGANGVLSLRGDLTAGGARQVNTNSIYPPLS